MKKRKIINRFLSHQFYISEYMIDDEDYEDTDQYPWSFKDDLVEILSYKIGSNIRNNIVCEP